MEKCEVVGEVDVQFAHHHNDLAERCGRFEPLTTNSYFRCHPHLDREAA
jgi:cysteinyl-tRNA synthetase